jgi:hypothetical protein
LSFFRLPAGWPSKRAWRAVFRGGALALVEPAVAILVEALDGLFAHFSQAAILLEHLAGLLRLGPLGIVELAVTILVKALDDLLAAVVSPATTLLAHGLVRRGLLVLVEPAVAVFVVIWPAPSGLAPAPVISSWAEAGTASRTAVKSVSETELVFMSGEI